MCAANFLQPNRNNVPDPADITLREGAEIEQLSGAKLRMAQYLYHAFLLISLQIYQKENYHMIVEDY